WQQWGIHSPAHWVAWQLGLSAGHAGQIVAVARRAKDLPCAVAALEAGELSLDQAAVVARHTPPEFDASVTALAKLASVTQMQRVLRRYAWHDPEDEPAPTSTTPRRQVSFGGRDDGTWQLRAELDADEGAVVEHALGVARDDLFRDRTTHNEHNDGGGGGGDRMVTWSDALVSMAEHYLRSGEASHVDARDRYRVLIHLEANATDPHGPPVAGLHLGAPLPDALRRLLTCDGTAKPVWERHGQPVSVGRSQRIVADRLRRLIEHRDGGCLVPGCGTTRFLVVHHLVHWEHGGTTEPANLIALCPRHHRLHHQHRLTIRGRPDHPGGVTFTTAGGRHLPPIGTPTPPTDPQDLHITPSPTNTHSAKPCNRNGSTSPPDHHRPHSSAEPDRIERRRVDMAPRPMPSAGRPAPGRGAGHRR
ncbi:MAG: hypothetical protein JWM05_77, partial [Acidimicrobiales bacterium]|nr:hypothetical protein [Acidimicrobiales bacterium]